MSILIKGIKLPTPPDELRLIIRPNGQVIICHRTEWDETKAVNVPPHGRLIDADALMKDGWVLNKQVMRMGGYAIHEMPLNYPTIPTIIEAEEVSE